MSGGGGGIIIIRSSIAKALENPLVSGELPRHLRERSYDLCAKNVNDWTQEDDRTALFLFNYAATHCG